MIKAWLKGGGTKSNLGHGLGNLCTGLQISSLKGTFEKTNAFLVHFIRSNETVHDKWRLHTSVRQTENGLKRGFVKHWLNFV